MRLIKIGVMVALMFLMSLFLVNAALDRNVVIDSKQVSILDVKELRGGVFEVNLSVDGVRKDFSVTNTFYDACVSVKGSAECKPYGVDVLEQQINQKVNPPSSIEDDTVTQTITKNDLFKTR